MPKAKPKSKARATPKKRKRGPFPWADVPWVPIVWFAFLIHLFIGANWSQLTSVTQVRANGIGRYDQERITDILKDELRNRPASQISEAKLIGRVLENPRIARVNFTKNIFGRGVLKVSTKAIVGRMAGPPERLLLEDGTIVRALVAAPEGVLELVLPDSSREPGLGLVSPWRRVAVAQVSSEIGKLMPQLQGRLIVRLDGALIVETEQGSTVRFGTIDRFDLKLKKLKEMLVAEPDLFEQTRRIDLLSPANPMVVR